VLIAGIFDTSDYLRLTASVRALEGISFAYPARIEGTDVDLVIGTALPAFELQSLLEQQPWLRRSEQGVLRWDALAMPLPQNQVQTGLAPTELQAQ